MFANTATTQLKSCFNDIVFPKMHLGSAAPWQKIRVRFYVVDQRKHFGCRIGNQRLPTDSTQDFAGLFEEVH